VTLHDLLEALSYRRSEMHQGLRSDLEIVAAISYVAGTGLFLIGSVFFLSVIDWTAGGAWCFIVGSGLFVVGASVNVLQIVQAGSLITLQLMNLTAVSFVVGSVLFAVASVPYLWSFDSDGDLFKLYTFLAWQYLIGSCLFLLGGLFNYWRACLVVRGQTRADKLKASDTKSIG